MDNVSMAKGTASLGGEGWDKNSIEALNEVFKITDSFVYSTHLHEKFDNTSRTVTFSGKGKWTYLKNLENFDNWVSQQIIRNYLDGHTEERDMLLDGSESRRYPSDFRKMTLLTNPKGWPTDSLKKYIYLIDHMEENQLTVEFEFFDCDGGFGFLNKASGFLKPSYGKLIWFDWTGE